MKVVSEAAANYQECRSVVAGPHNRRFPSRLIFTLHRPSIRAVAGRSICLLNRHPGLDQVRKALGDRGYITGQTIAAQTKNLKGDISLAALDAGGKSLGRVAQLFLKNGS